MIFLTSEGEHRAMKAALSILILSAGLAWFPVLAEDWTVAGKTYHNVMVGQVEADCVHITYDGVPVR